MAKIDGRILTLGAFVILAFILFATPGFMKKTSPYGNSMNGSIDIYSGRGGNASMMPQAPQEEQQQQQQQQQQVPQDVPMVTLDSNVDSTDLDPAPMNALSTSMLPRDIPSAEDFGAFSPDSILKGQNYLDPRAQIGYPETLGGVLRNPNYDIRSEPANPRVPVSIWNNSTISPDLMRPQFEIGR